MTGLLAALAVLAGGIAALLLIGLGIRFQISCLGRLAEADQTRGLPRRAWEIIIILLPTFGGILYLLFGRTGGSGERNGRRGAGHGLSVTCPSRDGRPSA
jgi:hypothetical protein